MPLATPLSPHTHWSSVVETDTTFDSSEGQRHGQDTEDLAAIVDLVERVAAAPDLSTACHAAAGELQQYLNCERVAFGINGRSGARCRLKAISGTSDFDPASPLTRAIESSFDEALLRGTATAWPPLVDTERHALAAHRQLAQNSGASAVFTIPLARLGKAAIGACTVFGSAERSVTTRQQRFVEAGASPLAAVLAVLSRGEARPWLRSMRRAFAEKIMSRPKFLTLLAAVGGSAMFLPIPYRVSCECQIQPVARRVVPAPFAGTLERSLVKPGDVVRRGDALGRMDGREIRWELAGLIADQSRAAKNRDVNMAENKIAVSQMDTLEMQVLQVKRGLLADRADHLDIRSPIDGVVVSGDLKRAEGAPVGVGQALYEIAPLDHMVAEIAIPDEEISHARPAQSVTISLDAYSNTTWTAKLASIQPRSESHDNDNVFIAEVSLDNSDRTLRPGMKGWAKIVTETHCLAWIMFHKPWNRVAGWFGW